MCGWGLGNPFAKRIENPVRNIGPPLTKGSLKYRPIKHRLYNPYTLMEIMFVKIFNLEEVLGYLDTICSLMHVNRL